MITKSLIIKTRLRLGETQTEFAKHFGVNQSTIHRWETGKLPIEGIIAHGVEAVLARLSYVYVDRQKASQ
jgi:DNA-binding XRE family transcriptional regulator